MKRALWIIGIIVLVLVIAVLALPLGLNVNTFRPRIEAELSSALGRQVKVGNLSLSILSGSLGADDISIADDPAFSRDPFVRAKSLKVGVELWPLIMSKTIHITGLTLDQPQVVLLRAPSGKWNFSSLGGKQTTPSQPSENPNLSVSKLQIKDGRVSLGNANSRKLHTYENVDVNVENFSFTSRFPLTLSANLPGGGTVKLQGDAGPINSTDAAATPLQAEMHVKQLDLGASGLVDPSSGIGGVADFDGNIKSDGSQLQSDGTVHAEKLKLAPKASPAGKPVQVKYALTHNLAQQAGQLTTGTVSMGRAAAQLLGSYKMLPDTTNLNMKLTGQGMPVDDLEAMLPAIGVALPSGSSLNGGTLSTNLAIAGTTDKLLVTGPIRLSDTKLAGFDLGSKLSAISKLSGAKTGSDTSIQNLSTDLHMAPNGIQTENLNLTVPALGVLTGSGTISPEGNLDYKMNANLSGNVVGSLTQLAGLGSRSANLSFFIRGTTSNPSFVPDVKGMLNNQLKSNFQSQPNEPSSVINKIGGLFGKKKKN